MTQHKQSHRIKWHDQHIKWHGMTCHVATNHSISPRVTSQPSTLLHLAPASNFVTSKQVTSPPWNSRRLVHSKEMVWASRWSVALRAFYRQILSLTYSFFSLKLPPPACPGTTGIYIYIQSYDIYIYTCLSHVKIICVFIYHIHQHISVYIYHKLSTQLLAPFLDIALLPVFQVFLWVSLRFLPAHRPLTDLASQDGEEVASGFHCFHCQGAVV